MRKLKVQSVIILPGRRHYFLKGLVFAVLLALLPAASGCRGSHAEEVSSPGAPTAAVVTVHPVQQQWRCAIEQPGQIEAFEETPIYANITGYVSDVCVDMNAWVKKGDILARMSVPEMDEDLKQKTALIAQAQTELELARKVFLTEVASLETAKAKVQEAQSRYKRTLASLAYWDAESKRIEKLVDRKVIDEQTRDEARNQYKSAEAESEESKAKIEGALAGLAESEARKNKAQAEIQATEARLQVAHVNKDRMAAMLKYATLTAPFDGVVTMRNVHPGHLLKPATSGKGEPLFVVVSTERVRIFVDVPETEAAYVRPGTPAQVRIHALKDCVIEASVIRISWALNPNNRTLRAEIELPNRDKVLRPGMYAFATLLVDHTVWAVPASCIQHKDDGCFCSAMTNGKATLLPVRIGVRQGAMVELLKKSVPASEAGGNNCWADFSGKESIVQDYAAIPNNGQPAAVP
jgi:HlyD family secretion protein